MPKSLPALNNFFLRRTLIMEHPPAALLIFLLTVFFIRLEFLPAQESGGLVQWYRSNASGLALEPIPSRLAAQRNEYSLSVETILPRALPALLVPYYNDSYRIELRTLYENGEEYRRQWIFRDAANNTRLTASGSAGLFDSGEPRDERGSGFIEILNSNGSVARELRFEEDQSEWEFLFRYADNFLLSTETRFKPAPGEEEAAPGFAPVFTDNYRYSRSGSLRAIDRTYFSGALPEGTDSSRLSFPQIGPGISLTQSIEAPVSFVPEFLLSVHSLEGMTASYTLDSRGRVLREFWTDGEGQIVSELLNTWSGDRLESVRWKSPDEDRLVEYEYDAEGNNTVERNFNQGILERTLTSRNGREIEEIYMNGRIILRAVWENGMKISEERVPAGTTIPSGRGNN